jgi:DNA-binding MarR family transcriptional regulator
VSASRQTAESAVAVRRAVLSLGRALKAQRPPDGRPSLELSVLGHLHRRGPMTPGQLAAAERVQPQTLTRTLTSLEEGRLITRAAHPRDGRRVLLALTETGFDGLRSDMAVRDAWLAAAMDRRLTGTERELLRLASELLERLADAEVPAGTAPELDHSELDHSGPDHSGPDQEPTARSR